VLKQRGSRIIRAKLSYFEGLNFCNYCSVKCEIWNVVWKMSWLNCGEISGE
jgi:hypothetical protein